MLKKKTQGSHKSRKKEEIMNVKHLSILMNLMYSMVLEVLQSRKKNEKVTDDSKKSIQIRLDMQSNDNGLRSPVNTEVYNYF